jgi:hypothetical protein
MITDKYPHHWSQPDGNGVHTVRKSRPDNKTVASLIAQTFNCNCTELDVYMARGKFKKRARILKGMADESDFLEMYNYNKDEEDFIRPRKK